MQVLNSLWFGRGLSYLEKLCLTSAVAAGHNFTVWSYEPETLGDVPSGVEIRDAADVMPREGLLRYRDTGSIALGANLWRIQLLSKGLGYWSDMDFIFLRPLKFQEPYVFGWEHAGWINNAILLAPQESSFVKDLLAIPVPNRRPPWFGVRRSIAYYIRRLREGNLGLEDMPWGTYSAGLVTHCVKKNKLQSFALGSDVFYPVEWKDAKKLYGPSEEVEALLTEKTHAVHMWHSRLGNLVLSPPPEGSYIHKMCEHFGVDTSS
jgi:hypothetical protein